MNVGTPETEGVDANVASLPQGAFGNYFYPAVNQGGDVGVGRGVVEVGRDVTVLHGY